MTATEDRVLREVAASRQYTGQRVEAIRHASQRMDASTILQIRGVAETVKHMDENTVRGMLLTALLVLANETDWSAQ